MKLSTEEQVNKIALQILTHSHYGASIKPIELPNDEEIEDETVSSGYGLKEYLAEEEAYTKFIEKLIKKPNNGK